MCDLNKLIFVWLSQILVYLPGWVSWDKFLIWFASFVCHKLLKWSHPSKVTHSFNKQQLVSVQIYLPQTNLLGLENKARKSNQFKTTHSRLRVDRTDCRWGYWRGTDCRWWDHFRWYDTCGCRWARWMPTKNMAEKKKFKLLCSPMSQDCG